MNLKHVRVSWQAWDSLRFFRWRKPPQHWPRRSRHHWVRRRRYTVLGANSIPTVGTVTCTDTGPGTTINGDVGTTFTGITNTSCAITGAIVAPVGGAVVTDFNVAYNAIAQPEPDCDGVIPTTSTTLPPGVYCSAAGTTIGTGVTLRSTGTASDVWVFRVGTSGLGRPHGHRLRRWSWAVARRRATCIGGPPRP